MNSIIKFLGWKIPFIVAIIGFVSLLVVACNGSGPVHTPGKNDPLPSVVDLETSKTAVHQASSDTKTIGEKVEKSAGVIETNAANIEKNTPPSSLPKVQPDLQSIKTETGELKKDSNELKVISGRLADTEAALTKEKSNVDKWMAYAKDADNTISALNKKISDLEQENSALFRRMMSYLVVLCVAGIGICAVLAFWTQSKTAIMVAGGFAVTLVVALGVSLYMQTLALIAVSVLGVAFLGICGYLAYRFFIQNRTEKELVQTTELAKQYLAPDTRQHIFGYGAEPGKIAHIQSDSTVARVDKIRSYTKAGKPGAVSLAPKMPEFWRPPDAVTNSFVDPYIGSISRGRPDTAI